MVNDWDANVAWHLPLLERDFGSNDLQLEVIIQHHLVIVSRLFKDANMLVESAKLTL